MMMIRLAGEDQFIQSALFPESADLIPAYKNSPEECRVHSSGLVGSRIESGDPTRRGSCQTTARRLPLGVATSLASTETFH